MTAVLGRDKALIIITYLKSDGKPPNSILLVRGPPAISPRCTSKTHFPLSYCIICSSTHACDIIIIILLVRQKFGKTSFSHINIIPHILFTISSYRSFAFTKYTSTTGIFSRWLCFAKSNLCIIRIYSRFYISSVLKQFFWRSII